MARPYRLPQGLARERLIDRTRPLAFTFDGRRMTGFAGDTLASALLGNGQRLMGRSFKYHRPRSAVGIGSEEMNALVGVGEGRRQEPNLRATQVELYDGLYAVSQNRWPSLAFDLSAAAGKVSRLLPAGFYYKTFMWPQSFWKGLYEPLIRRAAGLGRAALERDPASYEHMHAHCDVLVAGGGIAGLAAAEAAIAAGAKVIIADENAAFGGAADLAHAMIGSETAIAWADKKFQTLLEADNVHVLPRTTVAGHFHHNYVLMLERVADHDPAMVAMGTPRHRLWKVRAKQIVLATGAIERPIVFANNDDGYRTAIALKRAGVTVAQLVEARGNAESAVTAEARKAGIDIAAGAAISGVETGLGGRSIAQVRIAPYRAGRGRILSETKLACDFVAVSGGFNPAVHLWCHNGGKLTFDEALQSFRPDRHMDAMRAAGAVNGAMDSVTCLNQGYDAGAAAAKAVRGFAKKAKVQRAASAMEQQAAPEAVWFAPATGKYNEGNKHFVDYQNDVTAADLELALREGYESVEHTKRYTTLGMGTDQGRTSNINGLGVLAEATGRPIPEIGITTFRPPFTPVTFGAIAGAHVKERFQPVRQTAVFPWHVEHGAAFEPVGLWRRAYCYPKGAESRQGAIAREILTVRNRVGLLDASTLGKIEIKGPNAAEFLDRIYTNSMSTLKPGRARYGLMMNELGFLFDDGVTVRLGDDHFLMHTTSGGADRVAAWLEEWLQTEWTTLKVFITPVTEQWAQFAVAGSESRRVLQRLGGTIALDAESFPFMAMKEGWIGGYPVRVFRISFS